MQKVRSRSVKLELLLVVDTRFQVLFHSPPGVLFTFPSRYLFAIGRSGVFSLGTWSSQLPTGLHVSCGTQGTGSSTLAFAYAAITRYGQTFQTRSASLGRLNAGPTTPPLSPDVVWAPPPSLAATDGIFGLFSSPGGTKMFQFPPFTRTCLCIQQAVIDKIYRVSPFGYRRINTRLAVPRRFSQPSTSFIISERLGIPRVPLSA